MDAQEFANLQYDLQWLKNHGFEVTPAKAGSGYHDSSLILWHYSVFVAECGTFEGAVAFARGYEKGLEKLRWESPPKDDDGCRRSFIASHETDLGFRTAEDCQEWINLQHEPDKWRICTMSWKEE